MTNPTDWGNKENVAIAVRRTAIANHKQRVETSRFERRAARPGLPRRRQLSSERRIVDHRQLWIQLVFIDQRDQGNVFTLWPEGVQDQ